jgi:hypothetical protein
MVMLSGLMHVYGPPGSGKTMFSLSASNDATKIAFLDGDASKGKHLAAQSKINQYFDLTQEGAGMTEVGYQEMVLSIIEKLPDDLDLIVLDNSAELFKGAHSHVAVNRSKFRRKWSPKGQIAGSQEWIETRKTHLPRIYSSLQAKARLVIFTTHEKAQSDAGVKTGAMEPDSDPSLRTEAGVVIRLGNNTRDVTSAAPVGLVIKNTGKLNIETREVTRLLPQRIYPCTWAIIKGYIDTPVGDRNLTDDEMPDEFEYHLIEGTLNPEQKAIFEWRRNMAAIQAEAGLADAVLELVVEDGGTTPEVMLPALIVTELSEEYPNLDRDKARRVLDSIEVPSKDE